MGWLSFTTPGVGPAFKGPPAPYEGILLLHDYLVGRGIREATEMHEVTPQPAPIPVSSEASEAVEMGQSEVGRVDLHFRAKGGPRLR